ncbi:MAG: valine--tRNA ligase [Firmicutes bacterium]|nr:valine--tRNA ligase [Bacillota bacterium]
MDKSYNPKAFEQKIYARWLENNYFAAAPDKNKKPFTIMMPPPNITGQLHMGHALNNSIQDALTRYKRMRGFMALWLPGTDHASIATEVKIVEKLAAQGIDKKSLGREGFLKAAFDWNDQYGGRIVEQLKQLGCSCDWNRKAFTMDERCSKAVREVFVRLYEKGLIYRGERMINWCTECKTALSDAEVEHKESASGLWYLKYPVQGADGEFITVATTRPETMLGDTAVAVNPGDKRYVNFIGKSLALPLTDRIIPVIADSYVDAAFGTGAVKITPAHDPNDFEIGQRHKLNRIAVMDDGGVMNENAGAYKGLNRFDARKKIVHDMQQKGLLHKTESRKNNVGCCYRCDTVVEPMVSLQWFVSMQPLATPAIQAVESGKIKFVPKRFEKIYMHWMRNIRDWCISRQLWWGHRIPAFYCTACGNEEVSRHDLTACTACGGSVKQDEDVLDTWFSSALWPFSTLGWPDKNADLDYFYPTDVLVTAYDIIFFWVARMIFSGLEQMGDIPFSTVYINGLVRDAKGRKMSKSANNGIDPLDIIDQFGTDPLRFSLMNGIAPGGDQRFSADKIEGCRNFMNKLYNAAKFVMLNCADAVIVPDITAHKKLSAADNWILARYNTAVSAVTRAYDKFDAGQAAQRLYDFTRNEFCDWYVELAKADLADPERRKVTQNVLLYVLRGILKMLHPVIPFITEEIYMQLPNRDAQSIMISEFPKSVKTPAKQARSAAEFEHIIQLIRAVRAFRAEKNVPPSKRTALYLVPTADVSAPLTQSVGYIKRLAAATEVFFLTPSVPSAQLLTAAAAAYIPSADLTDNAAEKARLLKELAFAEAELKLAQTKLNNAGFTQKAPQALIDAEREKVQRFTQTVSKLTQSLKN